MANMSLEKFHLAYIPYVIMMVWNYFKKWNGCAKSLGQGDYYTGHKNMKDSFTKYVIVKNNYFI